MQAPLKQSPLYHVAHGLGATFGPHHGWNIALSFDTPEAEAAAIAGGVCISDASWLGKLELKGRPDELDALAIDEGKVWQLARGHYLVLCEPANSDVICNAVEQQTARYEDDNPGSANASVRPKPVAGPSVHGSTGSPRTDDSAASEVSIASDVAAVSDDSAAPGVSAVSDVSAAFDVSAASDTSTESSGQETLMGNGCVHIIDVTSTYAGILLAGPSSRDVLQRLTAPDVSNNALANGSCLSAKVAGLHARVIRDDLDEALAYWLFVGTEYAAYAWEAIMHAGRPFGMVPVGCEALMLARKGGS